MLAKLIIYVNFHNDTGVRYVAPIVFKDGSVGDFDERDDSCGWAHNTNEDWHEASQIFELVKDGYVAQVKDYFPLSFARYARIATELERDECFTADLLDPPAVNDLGNVDVFGEILFEAEEGEFPRPIAFSS
jgi:hypothetical protein